MNNLRALSQRCHVLHDRSHHLAQRWITYRRRLADGDLFVDPYSALIATSLSTWTAYRPSSASCPSLQAMWLEHVVPTRFVSPRGPPPRSCLGEYRIV